MQTEQPSCYGKMFPDLNHVSYNRPSTDGKAFTIEVTSRGPGASSACWTCTTRKAIATGCRIATSTVVAGCWSLWKRKPKRRLPLRSHSQAFQSR